jgi:excinuclease UvrABC nuclease subunit
MDSRLPYINDNYGQTYPDWSNIFKEKIRCGEGIYGIKYNNELIYVGVSDKIRNRIKRHFFSKHKELSDFLINNYKDISIVILSENKCFVKEKEFIKSYNPKFNRDKR